MPTETQWHEVFNDLKMKLNLPCRLWLAHQYCGIPVKIGMHTVDADGSCLIIVNPEIDFKGPQHLILHEGAHCRCMDFDAWHGHDERWAEVLCQMYREAKVALPESTGFEAFAIAAGIRHRS